MCINESLLPQISEFVFIVSSGQSSIQILDWVNEDLLGKNRVSFDTQLSPASLKIRNISESDAGLYRSVIQLKVTIKVYSLRSFVKGL